MLPRGISRVTICSFPCCGAAQGLPLVVRFLLEGMECQISSVL